jgi:hypothetical protein
MSKWKLSNIRCKYKGGGGGSSNVKTVENIPAWAVPYLKNVGNRAESEFNAGNLSKVAGADTLQNEAWSTGIGGVRDVSTANQEMFSDQAGRLTEMAKTGGANELQDALALDIGMNESSLGGQYGQTGTLGSYRHNLASATSADAAKAKFAQQVITNKAAAEQGLNTSAAGASADASNLLKSLESTGASKRAVNQAQLDKEWQGLQRYASTIYGNPARQTQEQKGGK